MSRSAIHPKAMSRLAAQGLFPYQAAIQVATETQSNSGQVIRGNWTTILGMENIPARKGPMSGSKARVGEEKKPYGTFEHELYEIILQAFYPDITTSMRVVLSDGKTYDITDIDWDSASTWTVLYVRYIVPSAEGGT